MTCGKKRASTEGSAETEREEDWEERKSESEGEHMIKEMDRGDFKEESVHHGHLIEHWPSFRYCNPPYPILLHSQPMASRPHAGNKGKLIMASIQ